MFPALAVAEELKALGADVVLFGMNSGMEKRLAKEHGIAFAAIDAAPLVGRGLMGKLIALGKLSLNTWRSRRLLRKKDVVAVLGTGGFVSAPTVLGARLAGIPIVLLEPNAEPGAANRLLSRWADLAAVAFAETGRHLHCETQVLGVPVRGEFAQVGAIERVRGSSFDLLIVGGSQGATRLNEELPALVARSIELGTVVHQCGQGHLGTAVDRWSEALGSSSLDSRSETEAELSSDHLKVRVVSFIDDMPDALQSAQLVISRAGAITLAELSVAARAAILVPLPLAGAHQLGNAKRQAALGAAFVVEQEDLDQVASILAGLSTDPGQLQRMAEAARTAARPHAARDIAIATREAALKAGRWAA